MKNLKNVFVLVLICLTVIACKKDDEAGDDPMGGTGSFTAKVDGTNYTGIDGAVAAQIQQAGPNELLAVSGGSANAENIQFIIQNFSGVGTYQLDFISIGTYTILPDVNDPTSVLIYTTSAPGGEPAGEANISSFDGDTVQGTFSFTGYKSDDQSQTVTVTVGEFNIELTN